jgi:hypothetical protein
MVELPALSHHSSNRIAILKIVLVIVFTIGINGIVQPITSNVLKFVVAVFKSERFKL